MEPETLIPRVGRRSTPLLRLVSSRVGGDLEPEFGSTQAGVLTVSHRSLAIPRLITPTGSVIVYLLQRELLSRSPPPRRRLLLDPAEHSRYTESAQSIFITCFESLVWVESMLGSATNPEAVRLFRGEIATDVISYAAWNIVRCLILLQTEIRPAQRHCIRCNLPAANARGIDENDAAHTVVVRRNHASGNSGSTVIDSVSVLPPLREFDPPMLCELHQYAFQYYMYLVVHPTWPVPHLRENIQRFGQIRVFRWSSDTNDFA